MHLSLEIVECGHHLTTEEIGAVDDVVRHIAAAAPELHHCRIAVSAPELDDAGRPTLFVVRVEAETPAGRIHATANRFPIGAATRRAFRLLLQRSARAAGGAATIRREPPQ